MAAPIAIWKQLLVAAALLGAAGWAWQDEAVRAQLVRAAGLAEEAAPSRGGGRDGVPVIVSGVGRAEDRLVLEIVGTGRAQRSIELRSEDAGRIESLALAPGRSFKAGDVLMRLEDAEQRLALSLAETRLEEAERVRERFSRLQTTGAASPARLDEVLTAAEIARIEVARAERALEDRTLRAPFDGVSGLPEIEEGDWVDSDVAIAPFDDRSVLLVEIDLPEAALARVRRGMPVEARTPAMPERTFGGTVSAIDSRIDPESRTVRLRVAIPNGDDVLRPGASFTIRLALDGEVYPTVPELAVQFARSGLHVWRVRDGTAERVGVRMVARRAGRVLVDGPLAEGDRVVVEGTQRLRPGAAVTVEGARGAPAS